MHKTESCRVQLNIVDTVMQRTESLSLSPLIMWPDQCILGWRERRGLMMKERVHKPHPLQIQMSFCLELYFYRTNVQFCPFGTGFVTNTIWERSGTKLLLCSLCGTCAAPPTTFWAPFPTSCFRKRGMNEAAAAGGSRCTNSVVLMPVSGKRWLVCSCLTCRSPPETQIWFKHGFLFKQNLGDSAVAFQVTPIREFHLSGSCQSSLPAAEQLLLSGSCNDTMSYCCHQCARVVCFDQILTSSMH